MNCGYVSPRHSGVCQTVLEKQVMESFYMRGRDICLNPSGEDPSVPRRGRGFTMDVGEPWSRQV